MKRKLIFLFIILIIVIIVFVIYKVVSDQTPKLGALRIKSDPSVTIFLDNKHIGRSNYDDKVAEGEYTLKLTPETTVTSTSSWQGKIKVYRNLLTYINAQLGDSEFTSAVDVLWLEKITSKLSDLTVITNPDGASISIDGESKGISPVTIPNVESGDHTIIVMSPGFVTRTIKVKTTSGYKLIATIKMALAAKSLEADLSATTSAIASVSGQIKSKIIPTPTINLKITPKLILSGTISPTIKQNVLLPEKPYIIIKDTPTVFLRVRSDASVNASESGRVKPGESYSIKDTKNGWYQILFDGINIGWVSGQYADKVE